MPLVAKHTHALAAARAECCAELMGVGDEMADKLMTAEVDDLTDDGCAAIAKGLGLDNGAFRACTSDPKTQQRIDADEADFKAAHGHGLPLIWIDDQLIDGAEGPDRLREAMDKAFAGVSK
jgi:predicted DsbA family dithiol-disulfide isomerase